jgi:hypothetical protein
MRYVLLLFVLWGFILPITEAQVLAFPRLKIPVKTGGQTLEDPWVGGLNTPQFSAADLNQDGVQDLVIFDRSGNIILTYLNEGTAGQVSYRFAPQYAVHFPLLNDYAILRDFNKDGAADIFTASTAPGTQEVQVWQGYFEGSQLRFKSFKFYYPTCSTCNPLYIYYPDEEPGFWNNLPVSKADLPSFEDVDGDGDIDLLSFEASAGGHVYWWENTSVEKGFGTDSLHFELKDRCWGRFYETGLDPCLNILSPDPTICATLFAGGNTGNNAEDGLHPGSTLMIYDQEGDGDMELVSGDISFDCFNMMTNGGTPEVAWMNAQDDAFPAYDESVDLPTFPASYYLDVDNDGKKDMIASPNNKSIGEDQRCAWWYKNVGTGANHVFELQNKKLFVEEMIDLGTSSHPAFADVNGDNLLDIVVGTYGYFSLPSNALNARLYLFLNTGTATQPEFTLSNNDWLGLSDYAPNDSDFSPTFGDIDGDEDLDLLVGNNGGNLYCFRNQAPLGSPMLFTQDFSSMWVSMDVGISSAPLIYDLDADGLPDILMGERQGNVNFFKNIGAGSNPQFSSTPTIQKLGNIDVREYGQAAGFSTINLVYTNDGPLLVVGGLNGKYLAFTNVTATADSFPLLSSQWGNIDDGERSHPALADLNTDGTLELLTGNLRGGLTLYKTTLTDVSVPVRTPITDVPALQISPNPATDVVRLSWSGHNTAQWRAFNAIGQLTAEGIYTQSTTLDVHTWPSGVYLIEVTSEGTRAIGKLVKN